jgi:hypothetical protein
MADIALVAVTEISISKTETSNKKHSSFDFPYYTNHHKFSPPPSIIGGVREGNGVKA